MATDERGPRDPRGDDRPDELADPLHEDGWGDADPAPEPDEADDSYGDWADDSPLPVESWGDSDP
jgi:hypothetical protein